jgi:D-alanyl-lipoteichoic acid acyltransferase DltB (MBOAT superfamily)
MLFNSIDFAIFFPLVFALYWLVSKHLHLRNGFILIASYVFYGWWDWRFLFLIAISSLVDYVVGKYLYKSKIVSKRKGLLLISLIVNLGFLVYFKYANFFIETFVDSFKLFGKDFETTTLNIILPVGISFYTFQTLSYTIDIYRKQLEPTKDALSFFAFVAFFPQLVAGPIERASHLLPQFYKTYKFNYDQVKSGLLLMAFGLFKKMVIADRLAIMVNQVYNNPLDHGGFDLIFATIFFAFQIYCDFSGYSDIAIGLARTMGFDLMKNFDTPYFSKSITEFWRRWHISLSTWFRDYVYIPLGGSRGGKYKTYFNLFIVFLVSGLWHGAAITFVIWGAIHGVIIVLEKALSPMFNRLMSKINFNTKSSGSIIFFTLLTFTIVCIAWVFFRANSFKDAIYFVTHFLSFDKSQGLGKLGLRMPEVNLAFFSLFALLIFEHFHRKYNMMAFINRESYLFRYSVYIVIVFIILIFGVYGEGSVSEFIYFQF